MKLHLASFRIPSAEILESLIGVTLEGLNIAVIANAKDQRTYRAEDVRLTHRFLGGLGISAQEVDLRDLANSTGVTEALSTFGMVYVMGGNGFVLREAMRASQFDEAIHGLVEAGLVYASESAGSVVAGRTLCGTETVDDTSKVDEPIFEGLGLIDKIIVPHASRRMYAGYLEHMRSTFESEELIILNDNEAYVVND
ncbi:MAG: Type 1 glutamine amidotransferase-like domain-containing protein [Patescibacteria group bacterium]